MAKAKVVSFGLRSKVFFSLISRDFHDLFFFLRNFLSTAWRVNRLQLPATEQVMIIICFACSNCRWNWVSEVEERLRFSGFQFIIFIAHMFQRRRQIELNWIKLYLLRNKKIFMFSAVCRAKKFPIIFCCIGIWPILRKYCIKNSVTNLSWLFHFISFWNLIYVMKQLKNGQLSRINVSNNETWLASLTLLILLH